MKLGMRTPSPTRSVKAKTTGRLKRAAKKSVNPVYGHKGMGYLKDPERAVKNKIYHKVTVDPLENMKKAEMPDIDIPISEQPYKKGSCLLVVSGAAFLISMTYTFIMLLCFRELHLRSVTIAGVSFVLLWIAERIYKKCEGQTDQDM